MTTKKPKILKNPFGNVKIPQNSPFQERSRGPKKFTAPSFDHLFEAGGEAAGNGKSSGRQGQNGSNFFKRKPATRAPKPRAAKPRAQGGRFKQVPLNAPQNSQHQAP
jgi:hypothetical protein